MDDADVSSSPVLISRFNRSVNESGDENFFAEKYRKLMDISNVSHLTTESTTALSDSLIKDFEDDSFEIVVKIPEMSKNVVEKENSKICIDLFQTARGSSIYVQNETLEKSNGMITNLSVNTPILKMKKNGLKNIKSSGRKAINYGKINLEKKNLNRINNIDEDFTQPITMTQIQVNKIDSQFTQPIEFAPPVLVKPIQKPTNSKLSKFNQLLEDLEMTPGCSNSENNFEATMFQTAKNLNSESSFIKVSKNSLKKGLSALSDLENSKIHTKMITKKAGFKPPRPKKLVENDQKIEKLKSWSSSHASKNGFSGFSTGLGQTVEISKDAISQSNIIFSEDFGKNIKSSKNLNFESTSSSIQFEGFSTGLGNVVKISQDAFNKANIFADSPEPKKNFRDISSFSGFSTGSGKVVKISDEALRKSKEFDTNDFKEPAGFSGFSTGLGNKVNISKEAIENANLSDKSTGSLDFCSFSTGLGKKVNISKDALDHANKLTTEKIQKFSGFSTGLGSKVKISDEALNQSKSSNFCGFSTGLGSTVKISKEALNIAKELTPENLSDEALQKMTETQKESEDFFAMLKKKTSGNRNEVESETSSVLPLPDFSNNSKIESEYDSDEGPPSPVFTPSQYRIKRKFSDISGIDPLPESPKRLKTEIQKKIDPDIKNEYKCLRLILTIPILNPEYRPSRYKFKETSKHTDDPFKKRLKHSKRPQFKLNPKLDPKSDSVLYKCFEAEANLVKETKVNNKKHFAIPFKGENTERNEPTKSEKSARNPAKKTSFQNPAKKSSFQNPAIKNGQNTPKSSFMPPTKSTPIVTNSKAEIPDIPLSPIGEIKEEFDEFDESIDFEIIQPVKNNFDLSQDQKNRLADLNSKIKFQIELGKETKKTGSANRPGSFYLRKKYHRDRKETISLSELKLTPKIWQSKLDKFNLFKFYSIEDILDGCKTSDNGILSCDDQGTFGFSKMLDCLLTSSMDQSIKNKVSLEWVQNHSVLIIAKLRGYQYNLAKNFETDMLTPETLMEQLRYRADLEFIDGKRSILFRISEGDLSPNQPMILYLSSHIPLRLSDGWYQANITGDHLIEKRLLKTKIGQKVLICGASLGKDAKNGHPLECPQVLSISANSTRRVKWDTKLGYFYSKIPPTPLSCLDDAGGLVYRTELTILKRYPQMWLIEDPSDGERRRKNMSKRQRDRMFNDRAIKQEKMRDSLIDNVQRSHRENLDESYANMTSANIAKLTNGEEIYSAVVLSKDPEIQLTLSPWQITEMQKFKEKAQYKMNDSLRQQLNENSRKTTNFFKFRVCCTVKGLEKHLVFTMSDPKMANLLQEGSHFEIFNANISNFGLAAVKRTVIQKIEKDKTFYKPSLPVALNKLNSTIALTHEVDIVGVIVEVLDHTFTIIDNSNAFVTVKSKNTWKYEALDKAISIGKLIAAKNLRIGNKSSLLFFDYRFGEVFSTLSEFQDQKSVLSKKFSSMKARISKVGPEAYLNAFSNSRTDSLPITPQKSFNSSLPQIQDTPIRLRGFQRNVSYSNSERKALLDRDISNYSRQDSTLPSFSENETPIQSSVLPSFKTPLKITKP